VIVKRLSIRERIKDKALLVFAALLIVLILVGTLIITENHYALSRDWSLFFLFSLGYIAMVLKGCKTPLKAKRNPFGFVFVMLFTAVGIASWAILFQLNIIPFPQRNIWTWGIGTTAFAYISIIACVEISKKMHRKTY